MTFLRKVATVAAAVGALLSVAAAPALAATTPDIVGGTLSTTAPSFLGSLQLDENNDPNWHRCGVTLISSIFVETNAHCVTNPPASGSAAAVARQRYASFLATNADPAIDYSDPSLYHIRFGSIDRLNGGVVRHLTKITVYPGWNWGTPDSKGEIGDIAILQLDQPVTTLKPGVLFHVDPAQLAREVGWGMTDEAGRAGWTGPVPEFLSQIDVQVSPNSACSSSGIGVGEICLGGQGGGICNGDSGSPALQTQGYGPPWSAVIGSASRIPLDTCGDVGESAVYTDVSYYVNWILGVEYGYPGN